MEVRILQVVIIELLPVILARIDNLREMSHTVIKTAREANPTPNNWRTRRDWEKENVA